MLFLVVAALGGGLATAALLGPVSPLAALITAPFVASAMAILASFLLAWRSSRDVRKTPVLDAQADAMVAALRTLTEQASPTVPAPKPATDRQRVA